MVINVEGIDAGDSLGVTVTDDAGGNYAVYQLDSGKYCFVADKDRIYHAVFKNGDGASMSSFIPVQGTGAQTDDILSDGYCAVKFGGESIADLFGGRQGIAPVSGIPGAYGEHDGSVRVTRGPSGFSAAAGRTPYMRSRKRCRISGLRTFSHVSRLFTGSPAKVRISSGTFVGRGSDAAPDASVTAANKIVKLISAFPFVRSSAYYYSIAGVAIAFHENLNQTRKKIFRR